VSLAAVITTIQPPTDCVRVLASRLGALDAPLYVVGDRKGPEAYDVDGTRLVPFGEQRDLGLGLAEVLPADHYTRKNLGYLLAIADGATCIYETDDDNGPNEHWALRELWVDAEEVVAGGWVNVFALFSDEVIWPRGFPLDLVSGARPESKQADPEPAPVQVGLIDRYPDVDAVWRVGRSHEVWLQRGPSVRLAPGTWCPFNSQSTWWWPVAFPLLYLPSTCTFRMTDIWRSFVAQRCLWKLGHGVVFHAAEVQHDRNVHDLVDDLADELPGYRHNKAIAEVLEGVELAQGEAEVGANLRRCYEALVGGGFVDPAELGLVDAWLADVASVSSSG